VWGGDGEGGAAYVGTTVMWILKQGVTMLVDWIDLTQDTNRWRHLVATVTNLRVPQKVWNPLTI
jgi:hypothetical protein